MLVFGNDFLFASGVSGMLINDALEVLLVTGLQVKMYELQNLKLVLKW